MTCRPAHGAALLRAVQAPSRVVSQTLNPQLHCVRGAGTIKMTQPTAFTVAMLAWGISAFPKAYTRTKQANAALSQVQVGISFLQKTMISYTAGSTDYYIAYQVRTGNQQ